VVDAFLRRSSSNDAAASSNAQQPEQPEQQQLVPETDEAEEPYVDYNDGTAISPQMIAAASEPFDEELDDSFLLSRHMPGGFLQDAGVVLLSKRQSDTSHATSAIAGSTQSNGTHSDSQYIHIDNQDDDDDDYDDDEFEGLEPCMSLCNHNVVPLYSLTDCAIAVSRPMTPVCLDGSVIRTGRLGASAAIYNDEHPSNISRTVSHIESADEASTLKPRKFANQDDDDDDDDDEDGAYVRHDEYEDDLEQRYYDDEDDDDDELLSMNPPSTSQYNGLDLLGMWQIVAAATSQSHRVVADRHCVVIVDTSSPNSLFLGSDDGMMTPHSAVHARLAREIIASAGWSPLVVSNPSKLNNHYAQSKLDTFDDDSTPLQARPKSRILFTDSVTDLLQATQQ
jgi:hypothetical protein